MSIEAICDCGKKYRVKDELAGRRVKCKECAGTFLIPANVETVEPVLEAEIVEASPTPRRGSENRNVTDQPRIQTELQYAQQASNSAASNPGMFRVSYLRWFMAFPTWVIVWHSLLLVSLLLTVLVHRAFGPLALLFAFAVYRYWHQVKYQFIAGCVNPAQVVSLHPPLVAVVTDLTKGGPSCLVAKVLRQPLSRMAGGPPHVGTGSFQYGELAGAFSYSKGLELAFKSGQRLLLSKSNFLSGTQVALDRLFSAILHVE